MDKQKICLQQQVTDSLIGLRLDQALAKLYPEFSRTQLQQWIKQGDVKLDGAICTKPRQKVSTAEQIEINATLAAKGEWQAQEIPLEIVHEDEALLVVNKPAGLVVHPGAGNPDKTLVNALLHHDPQLNTVPRAGIIHRLDKGTSGLLLIAKTLTSHNQLSKMMKQRQIKREYVALVTGNLIAGGTIDQPLNRHPNNRLKMTVSPNGREAITHYRVKQKFAAHTLLDIQLETGRTHQIRVHMNHIHHPVVGDPLYGRHIALPHRLTDQAKQALRHLDHQALHARQLSFDHPETGNTLQFQAKIPDDLQHLIGILQTGA